MSNPCLFPGCGVQIPCEQHPNYIHNEGPVAKSRRLETELSKALEDVAFEREMKLIFMNQPLRAHLREMYVRTTISLLNEWFSYNITEKTVLAVLATMDSGEE